MKSLSQAVLLYVLITSICFVGYAVFQRAFGSNNQHRKRNIVKNLRRIKDPIRIDEIIEFLSDWIHRLHETLLKAKGGTELDIWLAYHGLVVDSLIPWDQEYLKHGMPKRRSHNGNQSQESIFLSIASYRDENCVNTIQWAFGNATFPDRIFIGLVQQNCEDHCRSGVLENGRVMDAEPDLDCHRVFCRLEPHRCDQLRALHVNESESLGPYAARYFASKLWYGEEWYMQIDAHMTFLKGWDVVSVAMLQKAPSPKPVISHYPPGHKMDLVDQSTKPAGRLCGPLFATTSTENQIIRLEGLGKWDKVKLDIPRFAPFAAAGYFVAHSGFLREVPFDPLLPWIFMGEEIIMSTRLWTHGYDLFSPAQAVVGHIYRRPHKPKFWESNSRFFRKKGSPVLGDDLEVLVLNRIKYQLGYPEAARDMLRTKSLLSHLDIYSMGSKRPLKEYLDSVGLDMMRKEVNETGWCETGKVPPGKEHYRTLYRDAIREKRKEQEQKAVL